MALPAGIQPLASSGKVACCIYGVPGVGKTRFIGSGKNVLILRPPTDHTDSIRGGNSRNVKEWVIPDWDTMNEVYEYLASEGETWDWVWLDSISLWQDEGLGDIWKTVLSEKPHRSRYGLDVQEYGINMFRLATWIRETVGLQKFNFGVTAHAFWGKNIDDDELLMPFVQGKNMPEKISGCMNMVGFMEVRKIKRKGEDKAKSRRVINFQTTEKYYGKDQFDAFPGHRLIDPTMDAFTEAVEAARARETAANKTTPRRKVAAKKGTKNA